MSDFFYNLGRAAGRKLRKPKWILKSYFGSEEEAIRAERAVGREMADQMQAELKISDSPVYRELVNDVSARLVQRVKNPHRRFDFTVYASNDINAFALPGGFVFISSGLIDLCERSPDETAAVLGHETVHIISGHPLKRIMTSHSLNMIAAAFQRGGALGQLAKQTITQLIESSYSQENEFHADRYGALLAASAGFDPQGALRMLMRMQDKQRENPAGFNFFSTHPPLPERIRRLKKIVI